LKTDPRFQQRDNRKANRFVLTPLLEAKLQQNHTSYWVDVLNRKGIPSGEVASLEAALTSAQAQHRRVIEEVDTPGIGKVKLFNMSAKFSKTPAEITSPPPHLAEHTVEILTELGYTDEDLKLLREKNVV
jgi:crotonobetainyl-CoA:carnitine CoA-transferase CaiB-like acyl-CoA transferase